MADLIIDSENAKHLKGCGKISNQTLCGNVDVMEERYSYAYGEPDCPGCISVAKHVLKIATVKEIRSWKTK